MTQADLARRLGVTRGAVSHWYSGRSVPEGPTLAALADAVGVSARWIASGTGDQAPPSSRAAAPDDAVEQSLLHEFRTLAPAGRLALVALVVRIARESGAAEVVDIELAAATRAAVTSTRRGALEMLRAWLTLPESLRAAHKRRIEIDALRYSNPADDGEVPARPRPVVPTRHSR